MFLTEYEKEERMRKRKLKKRAEAVLFLLMAVIAVLAVIFVPVPTSGASENHVVIQAPHDEVSSEIVPESEVEWYEAVLRAEKKTIDDELAEMAGPITVASDTPELDMADDEFELLCMVVMAEGGYTEPDKGIRYMADGILNRVDSDRFPNTIAGVVMQSRQFSCVGNGAIYKYVPTERVISICAEEMVSRMNRKVIYWRTGHYHAGTSPIEEVGHHFYSGI